MDAVGAEFVGEGGGEGGGDIEVVDLQLFRHILQPDVKLGNPVVGEVAFVLRRLFPDRQDRLDVDLGIGVGRLDCLDQGGVLVDKRGFTLPSQLVDAEEQVNLLIVRLFQVLQGGQLFLSSRVIGVVELLEGRRRLDRQPDVGAGGRRDPGIEEQALGLGVADKDRVFKPAGVLGGVFRYRGAVIVPGRGGVGVKGFLYLCAGGFAAPGFTALSAAVGDHGRCLAGRGVGGAFTAPRRAAGFPAGGGAVLRRSGVPGTDGVDQRPGPEG